MKTIARTLEEVSRVLNEAAESVDAGGSRWPGMSYEQGVEAGIRWILGESDDNPMED